MQPGNVSLTLWMAWRNSGKIWYRPGALSHLAFECSHKLDANQCSPRSATRTWIAEVAWLQSQVLPMNQELGSEDQHVPMVLEHELMDEVQCRNHLWSRLWRRTGLGAGAPFGVAWRRTDLGGTAGSDGRCDPFPIGGTAGSGGRCDPFPLGGTAGSGGGFNPDPNGLLLVDLLLPQNPTKWGSQNPPPLNPDRLPQSPEAMVPPLSEYTDSPWYLLHGLRYLDDVWQQLIEMSFEGHRLRWGRRMIWRGTQEASMPLTWISYAKSFRPFSHHEPSWSAVTPQNRGPALSILISTFFSVACTETEESEDFDGSLFEQQLRISFQWLDLWFAGWA